MSDLPPIAIVLQTFKRTDVALRTIASVNANLRYKGNLAWYVADDGSPPEHVTDILRVLYETMPETIAYLGQHSERRGYGANANAAWRECDRYSPLTFWLEDDWELSAPLDLTPFAEALMDNDVGMIRLGYLNRGIGGSVVAAAGRLYWRLYHEPVESVELVFTGHPSLRHTRYRDAYGFYPEGLTPGDTELGYAYQYRKHSTGAPWIVWPCDYPPNGLFGHIGTVKTETML